MKRIIVAPTVLAMSETDFKRRWARITPISQRVQVDFMDGRFVKTKSVPPATVPDVRKSGKEFEAHLMVERPERWVPPLFAKGFKRAIVHIETISPVGFRDLAARARKSRAVLIAAINPGTPLRRILPYLPSAAGVCVLGVEPGRNGAPYDPRTPSRVRAIARRRCPVQVDGGMTPQTVGAVVRAGASRINSGSYVGNAADPRAALRDLARAVRA